MPPQNWPPASFPSWPPPEMGATSHRTANIQVLIDDLRPYNFTTANPTADENQTYFRNVRCVKGHPCSGIMLVSPSGTRYPFAYCTGATHKELLTLLPPYEMGGMSGNI